MEKAINADCHVRQTEPFLPWSNAAEGAIRELKKGGTRKMIRTGSPCCLWDHCLELEAYIQSHTALNSFALQGEMPKSYMTGKTPDISEYAEFAWYDWIKF